MKGSDINWFGKLDLMLLLKKIYLIYNRELYPSPVRKIYCYREMIYGEWSRHMLG